MTGVLISRGDGDVDSADRRVTMWRISEKVAICQSRREVSEETHPANNTFILVL